MKRDRVTDNDISPPSDFPPRKRKRVSEVDEASSISSDSFRLVVDEDRLSSSVDAGEVTDNGISPPSDFPPRKRKRVNEVDEASSISSDSFRLVVDEDRLSSSVDAGEVTDNGISPPSDFPPRKRKRVNEVDEASSISSDSFRLVVDEDRPSSSVDAGEVTDNCISPPSDFPPRKRKKVSEVDEASTGFNDEMRVRGVKMMTPLVGERPAMQASISSDSLRLVVDEDRPSSSVDACEATRNSKLESHTKEEMDDDAEKPQRKELKTETMEDTPETRRAKFEAKYEELGPIGAGGCGSVFAGYRKSDHLPVAIKHIKENRLLCKYQQKNGGQVSAEVAVMLRLKAGGSGSASEGQSSPVSLLDSYDLDQELILVLERPVPAVDLLHYIQQNEGPLDEDEAKVILKQVVDAAGHLKKKRIFHRDIKMENLLIETSSNVPRVRLIDFGLSCFTTKGSTYTKFYGTRIHIPPECWGEGFYTAGPTTVWQLGVLLFDTLHGKRFTTGGFLRKELTINCDLSEGCKDFLTKCLEEKPQNRPTLQQLHRHPWLT